MKKINKIIDKTTNHFHINELNLDIENGNFKLKKCYIFIAL